MFVFVCVLVRSRVCVRACARRLVHVFAHSFAGSFAYEFVHPKLFVGLFVLFGWYDWIGLGLLKSLWNGLSGWFGWLVRFFCCLCA